MHPVKLKLLEFEGRKFINLPKTPKPVFASSIFVVECCHPNIVSDLKLSSRAVWKPLELQGVLLYHLKVPI